jgi:hypothetical protein
MFLRELFEADDEDLKLSPGEKREIQVKLKDLRKIYNKISDTKQFLSNLEYQTAPSRSLATKYEEFKQEIKNKIKEYEDRLTTEKQKEYEENPELRQLIEKIRKNCSEYLKAVEESGGRYLYRGHKNANSAFVSRSSETREPKDSNKQEQKVFDAAMKLVGIAATRSNSIFCTPDYSQASGYTYDSSPHVLFPINGFNYLYTRENDLIMRTGYMLEFCDPKKMDAYIEALTNFLKEKYPKVETETTEKILKNLRYGSTIKIPNSSETAGVVSSEDYIVDSGKVEVHTNIGYKFFTLDDIIKANPEKNISIDTKINKVSDYSNIENYNIRNLVDFMIDSGEISKYKISQILRDYYDPSIIPGIPENLKFTESTYISFLDKDRITSLLKPQDSNLVEFLKNRNGEVCINGSYYALNYDDFEDLINREFTTIRR